MTDKAKIRIVVDEDAAVVARLDALAEREALSRADMLRRAIRLLVLSTPTFPTIANIPTTHEEIAA